MFDNILIDLVPTKAVFNNKEYVINSDFRIGIQYELLMQDNQVSNHDKVRHSIALFFYNEYNDSFTPDQVKDVLNYISYFYVGGTKRESGTGTSQRKSKAIYSYEHDAEYIFADFMSIYNINLQQVEYLHWWEFKALLAGLDEGSKLSKVIGYRTMKIDKDMSNKEKKHYRELKRIYKLPDNRTAEEKEKDFHGAMAGVF